MKTYLFNGYLILLHLLLLVFIVKSESYRAIVSYWQQPKESFDLCYQKTQAFYQRVDKNVQAGATLFLGDSLIQGMAVTSVTPNAINFGIGHDTTVGVLNRLPQYRSVKTAKQIVLSIGHNDLKYRQPLAIANNIEKIILLIPQTTPITLSAILAIDEQFITYTNNNEIKKLNDHLITLAAKFSNVTLLNVNDKLADKSGLKALYHLGDGVHLNEKGYHVWIQSLAQTIY